MLSLSMIVRDEAERIEACLRSVQGFVDEMVVVDTGSSDATVAIAEGLGATVHRIDWPGDFAPARNQALQWVNGDWVLVLDADERLRPEAREPLRRLMAEPDLLLINLLRQEIGALQSPYSNVSRLFRRHPAIRWSRAYHSLVDDSVVELLQRGKIIFQGFRNPMETLYVVAVIYFAMNFVLEQISRATEQRRQQR